MCRERFLCPVGAASARLGDLTSAGISAGNGKTLRTERAMAVFPDNWMVMGGPASQKAGMNGEVRRLRRPPAALLTVWLLARTGQSDSTNGKNVVSVLCNSRVLLLYSRGAPAVSDIRRDGGRALRLGRQRSLGVRHATELANLTIASAPPPAPHHPLPTRRYWKQIVRCTGVWIPYRRISRPLCVRRFSSASTL